MPGSPSKAPKRTTITSPLSGSEANSAEPQSPQKSFARPPSGSQRRSGAAASPSAHPAPGSFHVVAGEDRLKHWTPDDGGEKWFCGDCGSHIYAHNPNHADPVGIRMGAFDGDPGVRPDVRQFVRYAAPWEPIPDDGLPRFPERLPH